MGITFQSVFRLLSEWTWTAMSVLFSIFVYGWLFGLGVAILIVYLMVVQAMGHYLTARRMKLEVRPPEIMPFSTQIRVKCTPESVEKVAWTLIAGPMLGGLAAFALLPIYFWVGDKMWLWLAAVGFVINLMDLLPFISLKGDRLVSIVWSRSEGPAEHNLSGQWKVLIGKVHIVLCVLLASSMFWAAWLLPIH